MAAAGSPYPSAGIRRLSNTQIVNSIQDVFMGGAALDANLLPITRVRGGFDDQDLMLAVNTPFMTLVQEASEQASTYVVAHASALAGCDLSKVTCSNAYIQRVGRRAFRRPLTQDEVKAYANLVANPPAGTDAATALSTVVEAMIQSPYFIYRSELGMAKEGSDTVRSLTPYETAAAISYFVLNSAPDEALLDAADANALATPEQKAEQVVRLMQTPGAEAGLWNFLRQWANVNDGSTLAGALGASNPNLTLPMANAAVQQVRLGFANELFAGDGLWNNLLLSSSPYVPGLDGNYVLTPSDPATHTGFLTETAFLASQSDPNTFSPVHFGFFVATQLFCNSIPPPPANIPALPSDANGVATPRARFASHLTNPACATCHSHFQPMGWAFEQYRPDGTYAPEVAGARLDGSGSVVGTDVDGAFMGARGLAERVVQSEQAKACFTAKMYEYALGRSDAGVGQRSAVDQAGITASAAAFSANRTSITSLMVSIVQSDAFNMRDTALVPTGGERP